MSDTAQTTGGSETQAAGVTPNPTPGDGGLTPGAAPVVSSTVDDIEKQRAKWQDEAFRKGRNDGVEKGKAKALAEVLATLNVESLEEAQQHLAAVREAQADAEKQQLLSQDQEANAKLIRDLKEERRSLLAAVKEFEALKELYGRQQANMLHSELRTRLSRLGAIPDAVDDLVALVASDFRWTEDHKLDLATPDKGTVEDILEDLKSKKSYFFADSGKRGGGTPPNQTPQITPPLGASSSFQERLKAWNERKGR